MNRINNKRWNKSLGQIEGASKLACRDGASVAGSGVITSPRLAGLGSAFALLGLVSAAWLLPLPSAMAADAFCYDAAGNPVGTASGTDDEVACGQNAVASGANAIAIGKYATATAADAVALGYSATATGLKSIASGFGAVASGGNSLALSSQSVASGEYELSIGTFAGLTSAAVQAAGDIVYGPLNHLGQINIGSNAGRDVAGYNGVYIGGSAGQASTGIQNAAIGFFTGRSSIGDNNTAVGTRAGNNVRGDGNVAIGFGAGSYLGIPSPLLKVNNTVAVGTNARAAENDSMAIGSNAAANGPSSIAQGNGAVAGVSGDTAIANDIAIGTGAKATGGNSIAVGTGNVVSGANSGAFGDPNMITGSGSYAFGNNNIIDADNAFVLGNNVSIGTGLDGAVGIGNNSTVAALTVASYHPLGGTAVIGTAIGSNLVSVGSAGNERRLTNVAAGGAPTDAVNVSQLQSLASLMDASKVKYFSVNSTGGGNENNNGASGLDAVAIGKYATATTADAVALGYSATATGTKSIASGYGAVASGGNSVALSSESMAFGDYEMSVGTFAGLTSAAVKAAGDTAYGPLNHLGQINIGSNAGRDVAGYQGVFIGGSAGQKSTGIQNVAIGDRSGRSSTGDFNSALGARAGNGVTGNGNVALGYQAGSYIVADDTVALGNSARASVDGGVALGAGSAADTAAGIAGYVPPAADAAQAAAINATAGTLGAVSVGDAANGKFRQITGVAAGTADSDAVNVSQIKALDATIAASKVKYFSVNSTGGGNANNDGATGSDAIALGKDATAAGDTSLALGLGATADDANSVALGAGSATAATVGTAGTNIRGINYSFAGTAPVGTISVGSVGSERTITNVAAGRINIASTDAVNGSQLFATNSAINSIGALAGAGWNLSAQGSNTSNVAPGDTVDLKNSDGNLVVSKTAADDNVTFDLADDLNIASSVTVGDTVITTNGVSIGTNVVLGSTGLVIMGGPSVTTAGINAGSRAITNVAAGVAPTDAVNVSQLQGGVNDAVGRSNTYTDTQISQVNTSITNLDNRVTTVEGDITDIQGDVVDIQGDITNIDARVTTLEGRQGTKYYSVNSSGGGNANNDGATGADAIAIGKDASATATDSVAIGNGATATHANSIALGAGSATTVGAQTDYNAAYVGTSTSSGELNVGNRTITGVAPGFAGTDAVNVNQLNGGVNYAINQSNSYTDGRIDTLYGDVWNVRRGYRGATSSAMAMAGLPQAYVPGKSMLSMSLGGYQGEYGMAVGLSGITGSGRYVYNAQASGNTAHDFGFSVGAGIQW